MKSILQKNYITDEKAFWKDALFVFDSSALLNFYGYSDKAKGEIFKNFLSLKDRLWITNQTEYEYQKNKSKVLQKPKKLYDDLINVHFGSKEFENLKNKFQQLKNRTQKDHKHPFIPNNICDDFEIEINEFEKKLQRFTQVLKEEVENKKLEIDNSKDNDSVERSIYKHFKISNGYNYTQLLEIIKQGEFRFRNKIPPGYEDKEEKIGLQVYGDLIIWNQIIELAISQKKDIILIIDDVKIDWCYQNKKDKTLVDAPREELIKEISDLANVKFWLYSMPQFLQKSKDLLGSIITQEIIEEVTKSNNQSLSQIIIDAVSNWASAFWKTADIEIDVLGQFDLLLNFGHFSAGIDVKYYTTPRHKNAKETIYTAIQRILATDPHSRVREVVLVIVCSNEESMKEPLSVLDNLDKSTDSKITIAVGSLLDDNTFKLQKIVFRARVDLLMF